MALEGIPAWNIALPAGVSLPEGKLGHVFAQAYPPTDWNAYADFLRRAAREQVAIRKQTPYLTHSYYLIHHEPAGIVKVSTPTSLKCISTLTVAYHAGDSQTVVMGPGYGVLRPACHQTDKLAPTGIG